MWVDFESKCSNDGHVEEDQDDVNLSTYLKSTLQRRLIVSWKGGPNKLHKVMENIHMSSKSIKPDLWFEDEVSESDADNDSDIIQIPQDVNVLTSLPQQFLEAENIQNAIADLEQERLDNEELPDTPDIYIITRPTT